MNDEYRKPVLPGEWSDDIRENVAVVAATEALLVDLREAFHTNEAMSNLRAVFQPNVQLEMRIESSRKYTRIRFMDLTTLTKRVEEILKKHRCQLVGWPHRYGDTHVEYCIPRLGAINECISFKAQKPQPAKPTGATHGTE